jgi:hypothetical protein
MIARTVHSITPSTLHYDAVNIGIPAVFLLIVGVTDLLLHARIIQISTESLHIVRIIRKHLDTKTDNLH